MNMRVNLDASETIFFDKALESIEQEIYQVKYPLLRWASGEIYDIISTDGAGATSVGYNQYDTTGKHKVIATNAKDLPRTGVVGQQFLQAVKSVGGSYAYTFQDVRAGAFANQPLSSMLALADREAHMQEINRLAAYGQDEDGIIGFFNHPNIPSASVDNPGSGTEWINKTPAEITTDMTSCASAVVEVTEQVIAPNVMMLPIAQYNIITTKDAGVGVGETIYTNFLKVNPYIERIIPVNELKGAGPLGVDVMVCYNNSRRNAAFKMPMPYLVNPPQAQGLEFVINTEARWAGLQMYQPLSANISEGI